MFEDRDIPELIALGLVIFLGGIVVLCILLIALSLIISCFPVMMWETNHGEHTGLITASDKEGLIWKTWTIYFKTDAQSSQEDRYCLIDESLLEKIRDAQEKKQQVTIVYENYAIVGFPLCSGGDIITDVKQLGDTK
jgi:hypothetical protein